MITRERRLSEVTENVIPSQLRKMINIIQDGIIHLMLRLGLTLVRGRGQIWISTTIIKADARDLNQKGGPTVRSEMILKSISGN